MTTISIKFETGISEIDKILFSFERYMIIRDMLFIFLNRTRSIKTLDFNQIQFLYKSKVLNSPQYINKCVKDIFRNNNQRVRVMDITNILGGNIQ